MSRGHGIATALTDAAWRTSSYSGGQGNCVEVTQDLVHEVAVRDSKDREGPVLVFSRDAWVTFLDQLR